MRRKDRELSQEEALMIIKNTKMAVLSMISNDKRPYATPISPVFIDGKIFFHSSSSPDGLRKTSLLKDNHVVVTYVGYNENDLACLPGLSVNYVSAIVSGRASLVTDEQKKKALTIKLAEIQFPMAEKKGIEETYAGSHEYIDLWEIEITSVTGKGRNKHLYFKLEANESKA